MSIPHHLRDAVTAGRLIPFVGAGVSRSVCDREGIPLFPLWSDLLLRGAEVLEGMNRGTKATIVRAYLQESPPSYLKAAEEARAGMGNEWARFIGAALDPAKSRVDPQSLILAQLVWSLGSPLVITTNGDHVLEWAAPAGTDVRSLDISAAAEEAEILAGTALRHTVWHLHGLVSNKAEFILAPSEYDRLYPSQGQAQVRYKSAVGTLRQLMASHTFLFIGFSLDDAHFTGVLRDVSETYDGTTPTHFVLVRAADRAMMEAKLRDGRLPVEVHPFEEFGPPQVRCLQEIAHHAVGNPGRDRKGQARLDEYSPDRPVFHVPFRPKAGQVVGRQDVLAAIHHQLFHGPRTANGRTAVLQGIGGLGKTQVAVEYAFQFRDAYPNGVVWLTADQDMDAQLAALADQAGWVAPSSKQEHKIAVAQQRVRGTSHMLLVFDNVESFSMIESCLPYATAEPHVLVTSRYEQPGLVPIDIDPLGPAAAKELLFQEAQRSPMTPADRKAAADIVEKLGGLPLALELAGNYLRYRRQVSWAAYWELLQANLAKATAGMPLSSFTRHVPDLHSTLRISEEALQEESLLPEVLDLLTWSGSAPMGTSLMASVLGLENVAELASALGLGTALRILYRVPGTDRYWIHRLVREVRRGDFPLAPRREWVESRITRVAEWFAARREQFASLSEYEAEIDHLAAWRENAAGHLPVEVVRLSWLLAHPRFYEAKYEEAERLLSDAYARLQSAGVDAFLAAHVLNDYGLVLMRSGRLDQAMEVLRRACALRRDLLGEADEETIRTQGNIAAVHSQLSEHADAEDAGEAALALARANLGEEHPETARLWNDVGWIYGQAGDLRRELKYEKHALRIWRKRWGEAHPDTATAYNNVGSTLTDLGRARRGLRYTRKALRIWQKLFGELHPDTATAYSNVGQAFGAAGKSDLQLLYARKALARRKLVLGQWHPETANSYDSLATLYQQRGEFDRALHYARKALLIRRRVLNDLHVDTALSYAQVGKIHRALDAPGRAAAGYKRATALLVELVGWKDRRTLAFGTQLAVAYAADRRPVSAVKVLEEILANLPSHHPARPSVQALRDQFPF